MWMATGDLSWGLSFTAKQCWLAVQTPSRRQ